MSKKITEEEFLQRMYRNFIGIDIKLLEYNGSNNPCKIKCNKCGKIQEFKIARSAISRVQFCCEKPETFNEKVKRLYENSEYEYIKYIDHNYSIVKHKKCGLEMKRTRMSILDSPYKCSNCDNASTKQLITKQEIQERLDEMFPDGNIECLEYNGQLKKATYRCRNCGLIFKTTPVALAQSRGCPKCDKKISKGEKAVEKWLIENKIEYKTQIRFPDLNNGLSSYDFGIYENDKIIYFIEVQGEQHYKQVDYFKNNLEDQQRRDKIKKDYADFKEIPIIYIPVTKKIPNLDDYLNILKRSTTISDGE